ncbi:MAG: response regulator [Armatimonadota bacterium]|nr:response regulator [Armatimonadota bacterium]
MLSKGNVLVVDDEINLCRILSAKLAKDGYEVVTVHDGEQAVEKVKQSHFDVVLLDLILPKMDGLSALAHIRSMDNNIPVIIMTACENSEAIEQAMKKGISAYVNKPFDLDNLVALVRNTFHSNGHPREEQKPKSDATVLFIKSQPITLEIYNGSTSGQYPSRIEDKDERTITVLTPTRNGEDLAVPPRTLVRVGIPAKDAFYSFSSSTLSQRSGNPSVTVLDKPIVIYRTQRRQFARILANVPVRYCAVSDPTGLGGIPNAEAGWKRGMSCDVSAGGARIVVGEDLPPGTLVYLETDAIGEAGAVNVIGRVTRCNKDDQTAGHSYSIGVQFSAVSNNLRSVS